MSDKGQARPGADNDEDGSKKIAGNNDQGPSENTDSKSTNREVIHRNLRNHHCRLCNERDNSRMVQCDSCDCWYHFTCAEVTQGIEDLDWNCPSCDVGSVAEPQPLITAPSQEHIPAQLAHQPEKIQQQTGLEDKNSIRSRICKPGSCKSNSRKRMELELRKLEEAEAIEKRFLDEKYAILDAYGDESDNEDGGSLADKISQVQSWIQATDRLANKDDSGLPLDEMDKQLPTNSQILIQAAPDQRRSDHTRPPLRDCVRRYATLHNGRSSVIPSVPQAKTKSTHLQTQQQDQPTYNDGIQMQSRQIQTSARELPIRSGNPFPDSRMIQTRQSTGHHGVHLSNDREQINLKGIGSVNNLVPHQRSTTNFHRSRIERVDPVHDETVLLNRSQLAARHAVPTDLPEFSGNPEDWPLFLAMFNTSSQMCGFSNEENMMRLRKCLKGEALNRVRCELLHPSNVPSVLSTLKMLYGKPEAIIQAVIRKVKDLPSPKVDRLETIVDFALSVKNLCATIKACEISDYVYSASLRYELVERLPPTLKLEWARSARNVPVPTLFEFSSWLYSLAEDASAVMSTQCNTVGTEAKSRLKREMYLNFHGETDDKSDDEQNKLFDTPNSCEVCKRDCVSLPKCERFIELSYDSRWAMIKELKLCRKCLRRHNSSCSRKKMCGIGGCTYLHHPLLHGIKKTKELAADQIYASASMDRAESSVNYHQQRNNDVLFRVVPVTLYGPRKVVKTYAFLDDGSEITLLEQDLADELGIRGKPAPLCLRWTGDTRRIENASQKVNLHISSSSNQVPKFSLSNVRTVQNLQLKPQTMNISELQKQFHHLKGLPIESYCETSPRILIGLDHANLGHITKSFVGKPKEPIAVKTCLGWCVYGSTSTGSRHGNIVNNHIINICARNRENEVVLPNAMEEYSSADRMGMIKPCRPTERTQSTLGTLTRKTGMLYETDINSKGDNVVVSDKTRIALKHRQCLKSQMHGVQPLSNGLGTEITRCTEWHTATKPIQDPKFPRNRSKGEISAMKPPCDERVRSAIVQPCWKT